MQPIELWIGGVSLIENRSRFGFSLTANAFGVAVCLREQLGVLPIGMAADHCARGESRAAVAIGDLLAFAFHPLEDRLLIAQREIDPLDSRIDDLDPQPFEQWLAIGSALSQLLANLARQVFEDSCFHARWSGFGIIDHIIERTSGRPYADFMRTEVFLPLGLTRTAIDIPPEMENFSRRG